MLPNFIVAILIVLLTVILAKLVRKFAYRMMKRISKNEAIDRLTSSIAFFLFFILGIFIALRVLNLDKTVTSLLAGLGIVGLIMQGKYTHFSINGERRIDLDVGISYGDDLDKVEKVTLEAIKQISYLQKGKPVDLYFKEFGDSAIIFSVRYWVDYHTADYLRYLRAQSQGIKNIKKAFDKNDITITFPIRTIDFGIKGGKSLSDMLKESNSS